MLRQPTEIQFSNAAYATLGVGKTAHFQIDFTNPSKNPQHDARIQFGVCR